ncbi:hypothetical protein ACFU5Y_36235 [Streptomyces gardneri]|uniref:hypothetical protein n=1 Tax=Streptomyces gardneri TaxID=66892 RepID=UPI0036B23337
MRGRRPDGDSGEEGRTYETHIFGEVRGVVAPGGVIGSVHLGDDSYAERMRLVALDRSAPYDERYKAAEELIPYGRRYRENVISALNGVLEDVKSMEWRAMDPCEFNALGGWEYAVAAQLEVVGEKESAALAYEHVYHSQPGYRSQAVEALTRLGAMGTLSASRTEKVVRLEARNDLLYCGQRMAAVVEWMSMPKAAVHSTLVVRALMAAALWDAMFADSSTSDDDEAAMEVLERLVPEYYADIEKRLRRARARESAGSRTARLDARYKPPRGMRNWSKAPRLIEREERKSRQGR